jgi:hypothetical protein
MFTWICPKCGREVPPAYSDCPNCVQREAAKAASVPVEPPPPAGPPFYQAPVAPPPVAAPPPPQGPVPPWATAPPPAPQAPTYSAPPAAPTYYAPPPPPQPVYAAPQPAVAQPMPAAPNFGGGAYAPAPPRTPAKSLPGWLVGILAVVGIGAVLAVLYVYVLPSKKSETVAATSGAAQMTSVPAAGGASHGVNHGANPLAKFLEIAGVRVSDDAKGKLHVHFVVVNHSSADLPELSMNVIVKAGDKPFIEIPVKVPSIGPFESKDLESTAKSSLKGYELPDWQFLKADFEITSAAQ